MQYNGYTRTCGLIGNPVEHTLSPLIHNHIAEANGDNMVYVPFPVENGRLGAAIKGAYALNLLGMNVTVPYKSDVLEHLVAIDGLAAKIGAVNTLVRMDDGYKGYNTDMPGLYRAMVKDGVELTNRKVIILGAGGVARAVAIMLLEKGAAGVILLNRTVQKALTIAQEVNDLAGFAFAQALETSDYIKLTEEKYLVIQATSVGMFPKVDQAVIEDEEFYKKVEIGYDLIYNPGKTKFMKLTEASGGKAYNGARMLLYQGIIAYELWNDTVISDELADEVYDKMLAVYFTTEGINRYEEEQCSAHRLYGQR